MLTAAQQLKEAHAFAWRGDHPNIISEGRDEVRNKPQQFVAKSGHRTSKASCKGDGGPDHGDLAQSKLI